GTDEVLKAGRPDVIVAGLTPSMLAIGAYAVARVRRVPFVLDERDLALDVADRLGLIPRLPLRAARRLEGYLHRHADGVVVVTPGIRQILLERGVPDDRIMVVLNGLETVDPAGSDSA